MIFLKVITGTIIIFFTSILQLFIVNFSPFPFDHLNTIFIIMIWFMIVYRSTTVLWLVVPLSFIMEFFSSFPFGFVMLSTFIGLGVVRWLLLTLFTNRSVYIVFISGLIGLSAYYILLIGITFILNSFYTTAGFSILQLAINGLWSIIISSVTLTIFYWFGSLFLKQLNPQYISLRRSLL